MSEILDQIPSDIPFIDTPTFEYNHENAEDYYSSDEDDESIDSDLELINAQLQWEESLKQLTTLVNIVILPLIGKVIGRRFAGIIWRAAWNYFAT